ncbi:MAG: hypothetical protein V3S49_04890 [Thermodesulfobacteriota bacterium]
MKYAQDYIKGDRHDMAGFNNRIMGSVYNEVFKYPHNYDMFSGWEIAGKMIADGKIYFLHNFHNSHSGCTGYAFQYGGFWVCNTCRKKSVDDKWWIIKVYKDGNAWCCVGEDFEDLQTSGNYAFGDTREEAIKNYGDIMHQS